MLSDAVDRQANGDLMTERRRNRRTEISSDASFFFGTSKSIFQGAALDISNAGAKLAMDRFYALPKNFLLSFDQFNTGQSCRVVWSRGNFLGVHFEPARLPLSAADTGERSAR